MWYGGNIPRGYGLPYDQVYGHATMQGRNVIMTGLAPVFSPTTFGAFTLPFSATFRAPAQPYGYVIAAPIVAALIGAGTAAASTAVGLASLKSQKNQALRESNSCIAKIDGEIQALRNAKSKGRRKAIKALLKKRKLFAKNPAMCKMPAPAQALAAEAMPLSDAELTMASGQTEAMAVAEGSASPLPWVLGGTLAVFVVGAVAFAASRSGSKK
jgi:hypothetical protein